MGITFPPLQLGGVHAVEGAGRSWMSACGSWAGFFGSFGIDIRVCVTAQRMAYHASNGKWLVDDVTESPEAGAIQAFLAQRVREGASASQVAEMVVSAWQHISAALAPVIGQQGVSALYKRSIHLTISGNPWIAACSDGAPDAMDLSVLKTVLASQAGGEAAAGGGALLAGLHELVATLIGPKLTEQLLASVWVKLFSGTSAQDPPP